MTDPDKTFINWAVSDLRRLNANMCREEATFVLSIWEQMVQLRKGSPEVAAELTPLVLAHFPAAEPPNVPGRDWLAEATADAAVLVAETVAVLNKPKAEPGANVLRDATVGALPEPKPGQQYIDFEGDPWQVQSDGTLLWLDTKDIKDRQAGLTKPNLLHLAKDFGPLTAGPLVEVVPPPNTSCVCAPYSPYCEGPQRECPIHGDDDNRIAQPTDEAQPKRVRMGDACGLEHTYRDACQYAAEAKS